jgi:hypothetical protein
MMKTGDNGTSAEGSTIGTPFDLAAIQGINVPIADQLKFYDVWGSSVTTPHMSGAWSWAFDTPFKWTKQVASHFGGTRQGMAIAWPNRIKDAGGIRTQFHHMYDGPGFAKGGSGVLKVDNKEVANKQAPHTMPFIMTIDETFDVGVDTRTPVDDNDYQRLVRCRCRCCRSCRRDSPGSGQHQRRQCERLRCRRRCRQRLCYGGDLCHAARRLRLQSLRRHNLLQVRCNVVQSLLRGERTLLSGGACSLICLRQSPDGGSEMIAQIR